MIHRRILPFLLLALCAATDSSSADEEFLIVRADLSTEIVDVVEIDGGHLVHVSEDGGWQKISLDDCVAMMRTESSPPSGRAGLVEMTDGQRLPGVPGRVVSEEERLSWVQSLLGEISIPLEKLRRVRFTERRPRAIDAHEGDDVHLANGDVLEGFLIGVGNPIAIEVAGDPPQVLEVPLSRVRGLSLVTPPTNASGQRVWFEDGTVLDLEDLIVDSSSTLMGRHALMDDSRAAAVKVHLEKVTGIRFRSDELTPLSDVTPHSVSGPETRYITPEPRHIGVGAPLDLAAIELQGPVTVRYPLPAGAHRFATDVQLPPGSRDWGDVIVVVYDDATEVSRHHLSRLNPSASINVALSGTELTIELAPAAHGPVQDRVLLERAFIAH